MNNPVFVRSAEFLVQISIFYEKFCETDLDNTVAKQLLLSATSCGSNINKSIYGEDRNDFVGLLHKSLKDIAESIYLLNVLMQSNLFSYNYAFLLQLADEIKNMLISSINAAKASAPRKRYDAYAPAPAYPASIIE